MPNVCIKTDYDTKGNSNWSPNAGSSFTINGVSVALLGDVGGSATITQGSSRITVNGVPVAYMGCKTTEGTMLAAQALVMVSV